jgi:hypothetical protein
MEKLKIFKTNVLSKLESDIKNNIQQSNIFLHFSKRIFFHTFHGDKLNFEIE